MGEARALRRGGAGGVGHGRMTSGEQILLQELPADSTMSTADAPPSYDRPYRGLTVLDLSQGIAGPYCGMLLAQYGADVIKVEPASGDWGRALGQRFGDHSPMDLTVNRGKRSIALDLKPEAGRAVLKRLAERADVILENFRPGVVDRLGVGYTAVYASNPKVIYVSISGFGQQGPSRDLPGSDTVIQAFSGMMSANVDALGTPRPTGFLTVDYGTALYAFQAVAATLAARPFEKVGRYLDVSLMQSAGAFLAMKVIEERFEGGVAPRLNAPAGSYRTADGWIAVTLTRESHFAAILQAMGRADLARDERFSSFASRGKHIDVLVPLLQQTLATRTTAEWLAAFRAVDVLASEIHGFTSWLDDPQVRASGVVEELAVPGAPAVPWVHVPGLPRPGAGDVRSRFPDIGADGPAILADVLAMPSSDIDALRAAGVLLAGAG